VGSESRCTRCFLVPRGTFWCLGGLYTALYLNVGREENARRLLAGPNAYVSHITGIYGEMAHVGRVPVQSVKRLLDSTGALRTGLNRVYFFSFITVVVERVRWDVLKIW